MTSTTIHSAARTCQRSLQRYATEPTSDSWAEERLVEFNIWSATSGALVEGRHALDERLRCSAAMAVVVANLLRVLNTYIETCGQPHGSGHAENLLPGRTTSQPLFYDKSPQRTTQPPSDTTSGARVRVESTFAQIVRITKRVTWSLTGSMLWLADGLLPKSDQEEDIRSHLQRFREETEQRMKRKTDRLDAVQKRLVDANVRRRRRFILASNLWVAIRGEKESVAEFSNVPIGNPTVPKSKAEYPSPPVLPPDCKSFKCPYCCQVMPSYMADPDPWQRHIVADLCPFVCVFADCPSPRQDLMYASRADWETHLYECHGSPGWLCQACGEESNSIDQFSTHLREKHNSDGDISASKIAVIAETSSRRRITQELCCPLCPDAQKGKDSLDHIADCLQELAIETLYHTAFSSLAPPTKMLQSAPIIVPQLEITPITNLTSRHFPIRSVLDDFEHAFSQPNRARRGVQRTPPRLPHGNTDGGAVISSLTTNTMLGGIRSNGSLRSARSARSSRSARSPRSAKSPRYARSQWSGRSSVSQTGSLVKSDSQASPSSSWQLKYWKENWEPLDTQHESKDWRDKPLEAEITVGERLNKFDYAMSSSSSAIR
ncbi:hypothetical protein G7Z17_g2995 [Cylindrodendrum hubeiense]|uniref:C2H2-type domain-containing protein n=1 Tax=Cylindrodendrum hubeiense TaxID=595255 RepID=A0A9P5LIK1_9HYPO|nr:hypothetical protein G7Z17_g2995 [Cylindrodendrum hubeiense]